MKKDLEPDSWVLKFQEFTSDEAVVLTLENLKFPVLTEPGDIETFFEALRNDSHDPVIYKNLALIINKNPEIAWTMVSTLRNVVDSKKWGPTEKWPNNNTLER